MLSCIPQGLMVVTQSEMKILFINKVLSEFLGVEKLVQEQDSLDLKIFIPYNVGETRLLKNGDKA